MKKLYTYVLLAFITVLVSCGQENNTVYPDIKLGDNKEMVTLDKKTSSDLMLSGGNGKFKVVVEDVKIATAKLDEEKATVKITGVAYGSTKLRVSSADKSKDFTINVERPEFILPESPLMLSPGLERYEVRVSGGGDDSSLEEDDPQEAISFTWDAKTGNLLIDTAHEGEAVIRFVSKDGKPAKELKVIVKAKDPEHLAERMVGLYNTTSESLYPMFPSVLVAYRPGKKLWISASTVLRYDTKRVVMNAIDKPQKGATITHSIETVGLSSVKSGEHSFVVENVLENSGLAVLRAKGFKLVVPFKTN